MTKYHKIQTVFKRDPANKHKTLLEGVFALPEFDYLQNNDWNMTEKIHGMNMRMVWEDNQYRFAGKTDNAHIHQHLLDRMQTLFAGQEDFMRQNWPEGATIYGEGFGAGIQKGGGNYQQHKDFVVFDILVGGKWWLSRPDVEDVCMAMGLGIVPMVHTGTLWDMVDICRKGLTSKWGDFEAEGLVAKPRVEMTDRFGNRVITKLKCSDFQEKKVN